jgi:hypothetical protein
MRIDSCWNRRFLVKGCRVGFKNFPIAVSGVRSSACFRRAHGFSDRGALCAAVSLGGLEWTGAHALPGSLNAGLDEAGGQASRYSHTGICPKW